MPERGLDDGTCARRAWEWDVRLPPAGVLNAAVRRADCISPLIVQTYQKWVLTYSQNCPQLHQFDGFIQGALSTHKAAYSGPVRPGFGRWFIANQRALRICILEKFG